MFERQSAASALELSTSFSSVRSPSLHFDTTGVHRFSTSIKLPVRESREIQKIYPLSIMNNRKLRLKKSDRTYVLSGVDNFLRNERRNLIRSDKETRADKTTERRIVWRKILIPPDIGHRSTLYSSLVPGP